ncbi:MAG: sugar phosphate isomerase/epimerase family protein [Thermoguttaceae bacterium]|jgi:sugar phosphate isomerase/epimerase|nr:sugar phosphate isomerase/epimerase family protein [Thermoguttaceae bacterium]
MTNRLSRRALLVGAGAGLLLAPGWRALLADHDRAFRIGACDWSLGKGQKLEALELAEQIGLDGVEVSFNGGPVNDLRDEEVRQAYLAEARQRNVEICSLAMGILNRVPYATNPQAEAWVAESIDVMAKMDVRVMLLAFFFEGDIKGDSQLQAAVVERLKRIAPKAEAAGVVFGLETTLNAEEHIRILDAVGSPAVKVYYDVSNMLRRGYDIYEEIPRLGDRICRIHMKEVDCLLGQGGVDFPRVRKAIDKIGYRDWLVIESATVKGRPVADCYRDNLKYLRSLFPNA